MSADSHLSVVCPVYNEEAGLEEFHRRLTDALVAIEPAVTREIIYVNDGSTDGSSGLLRKLAENDPSVRVIELSRDFGHQVAITAGIDKSSGDGVVVIDSDLQDPPEVIVEMVDRWREGFKVVYGVRTQRDGERRIKLWTAKVFYRLLDRLSDTDLPVDSGDFRLMDRQVVEALKQIREESRYIRGLVSWVGFNQCAVNYERDARFAGETSYSVARLFRLAFDGITSFSDKPLRLSTQLGVMTTCLTLILAAWIIVGKILNPQSAIPGYASLMCVTLFIGGIQLMSIGILGEYMGRTYRETKRRPLYIIAEEFGGDREP